MTVVEPGRCRLESVGGLVDQGGAVGEEEHSLDPVRLLQQIDERDGGAGLARASCHHQEGLALLAVERITHGLDRPHLVRPTSDVGVRLRRRQGELGLATLDQQLQLVAGVEALGLTRRVAAGVVPDPVLVAVGVEDHRPPAELLLQAVGVELGLLLADLGRLGGALGLDHRQRQTIGAPQDVVDEALALGVGHAGDRVLAVALLIQRPPGLVQQDVDEQVACGSLVVVARVRGCGCLSRSDLRLELGDLGLVGGEPLVLLGQLARMRLVLGLELRRERATSSRDSGAALAAIAGSNCACNGTTPGCGEWWYDVHTTTLNSSRSTASDTSGRICRFSWTAVLAIRRIAVSFCVMPCGTFALKAASLIFAARSSR